MNMSTGRKADKRFMLLLATAAFYMLTVLPHEVVGAAIGSLFEESGRQVYDRTMLIILMAALAIYAGMLIRSLNKNRDRLIKGLIFLAVTLVLCILSMKMLVVINVEAIHFVQYGILAALVFQLVRRYDYTCWIILLLAFFDESYQHFFLTPNRFAHLDFNDIFLDLVGAGFGLSSLYCLGKRNGPQIPAIRNGIIGAYTAIIISASILYITGHMRIWPTDGEELAPVQIFHKKISGFWTTVRKVHQYHIMRPIEGIVAFVLTNLFYSRLGD